MGTLGDAVVVVVIIVGTEAVDVVVVVIGDAATVVVVVAGGTGWILIDIDTVGGLKIGSIFVDSED